MEENKEKLETQQIADDDVFEGEEGKKLRQYTPLKTPEPELELKEAVQVQATIEDDYQDDFADGSPEVAKNESPDVAKNESPKVGEQSPN